MSDPEMKFSNLENFNEENENKKSWEKKNKEEGRENASVGECGIDTAKNTECNASKNEASVEKKNKSYEASIKGNMHEYKNPVSELPGTALSKTCLIEDNIPESVTQREDKEHKNSSERTENINAGLASNIKSKDVKLLSPAEVQEIMEKEELKITKKSQQNIPRADEIKTNGNLIEVKGQKKQTEGVVDGPQQKSLGICSESKPAGVLDEELKKSLGKITGISPGTIRSIGAAGLKGSSLPLILSMPGGAGGLSLLSAGLPPGRYVILPSTTSSIPSISSIASTTPVAGIKPQIITQIPQISKSVISAAVAPSPSTTIPTTSSAVTTMTTLTTATSIVPSIVIPPAPVRIVRSVARGNCCGGRSVRGRRKSYTAAEKLAMIEAVESGQKKSNVADLFGVAPSTLACILLQKNKIRSDQMKVDLSRRRLRQSRQTTLMPTTLSRTSASGGEPDRGSDNPFVHFLSPLSTPRPTVFEDSPEEIISMPDLSDRIGMEPTSVASKTDVATSNYLTCSPLLSGMSGLHEDLMHGGAGPSSSHDAGEGDNSMQHEYEQEELVDVKAEPVYGGGSEICEDENSQNNTLSSGDRRSSQSSPTPTAMAGPYLLKKETHCTTILDQLLRDDTFSDVTLTAEGQSIRAHKIVLCLASAYFRQVLSRESSVQNVIVFRDIKFSELRNLINFIYTGEATVDASDLESFMKTAEMLEVNSLSDGQRSLPKNFFPKARDPEPETRAPRVGTSSKRAMNSGAGSPPAKSRRTSADVSPPSRSHKSPYHSSSASQETFVSGGIMGTPLPVIKTEPKTEEMIVEDDYQSRECDDESYGNHASSPTQASQHHHPTTLSNSPPPEEFSDHSLIDKTPPGKCPFCPGSPQVRKETALTKHLYLCHPDRSPYSCDDCARAFLKKGAYEAHKDDCR